jgi:hypothetical protein
MRLREQDSGNPIQILRFVRPRLLRKGIAVAAVVLGMKMRKGPEIRMMV